MTVPRHISEIASGIGFPIETAEQITDAGLVNEVWLLNCSSDKCVVRLNLAHPSDRAFKEFSIESACYDAVGTDIGPRVRKIGFLEERAYMVMDYVLGERGEDLAKSQVWQCLGSTLRAVHECRLDHSLLTAFGVQEPSRPWLKQRASNIELLSPSDPLVAVGIYSVKDIPNLATRFSSLPLGPVGLCHGDVCPRNIIVNGDHGTLIDWGCAELTITPYFDMENAVRDQLLNENRSGYDLPSFASGYGWALGELVEHQENCLNYCLLKSFDLVRWAIDRCPFRTEELAERAKLIWEKVGILDDQETAIW